MSLITFLLANEIQEYATTVSEFNYFKFLSIKIFNHFHSSHQMNAN